MTGRTSKNKMSTPANTARLVLVSLPPPSRLFLSSSSAAPRGPMADRIPYSMIPNYNPALVHQQQQAQQQHQIQPQQQQPQQQQQDAFPDNSRIWSHSQMRSHPPDLAAMQQSNPQVHFPTFSPSKRPSHLSFLSLRIFFACVPKHSLSYSNFLNTPPSRTRLSNRSPSTPT